jgi:hypothetical protein
MMTKSDITSLKLARQENAQAIAQLINRWLEPRGITATATREEHCFEIRFEVDSPPNPKVLMALVGKVLRYLGMVPVKTLKISVYLKSEQEPLWQQEVDLMPKFPPAHKLINENGGAMPLSLSWVDTWAGKLCMSLPIGLAILAVFMTWVQPKQSLGRLFTASTPAAFTSTPTPVPAPALVTPTPNLPISKSTPTPTSALSRSPSTPTPKPGTPSFVPVQTAQSTPRPTAPATPPLNPHFYQAVSTALNASKLAQTARSSAQWQTVAAEWQVAVAAMQAVPASDSKYSLAQQKVQEYQRKLKYAQAKATSKPPVAPSRRR